MASMELCTNSSDTPIWLAVNYKCDMWMMVNGTRNGYYERNLSVEYVEHH